MISKLDVGCGSRPTGHVNLDLRNGKFAHKRHFTLPMKEISNFILGDASHLPFKDSCFKEVVSFHVIEHVKHPCQMLTELVRVSNHKIILKTPHRLAEGKIRHKQFHINFFNRTWFVQFLQDINKVRRVIVSVTMYKPLLHILPFLPFYPSEITVEIYVKEKKEK